MLFLAGMLAVLFIAAPLQQAHFGWGLLATELILGALALLWTRLKRLPWRETLRLYPATPRSLAWAFVMGVGIWLVDSWLGGVTASVLGYHVPVPPGAYPQSVAAAALLFVGMAVAAPLGEELFFRGYMQQAYGRLRPFVAIVVVAALFALFHLSLAGFAPRLPIALALGYVAWRSGSLWPGVVLHAANNVMAVLLLSLVGLRPGLLASLDSHVLAPGALPAALVGLALFALALWQFRRSVKPRRPPDAAPEAAPAAARRRVLAALPLALALLIFGGLAVVEVVMGRFPELLAVEPLTLEPAPWSEEVTWQYRLQHPGQQTVGEAACTLTPATSGMTLDCALQHEPFEVQVGNSTWAGGALTRHFTAVYDAAGGGLQQLDDTQAYGYMGYAVTARAQGERLLLQVAGANVGESSVQIAPLTLVDAQWPWQLCGLPFVAGAAHKAELVYPQRYEPSLEMSVLSLTETAVIISGVEPLSVPAGDFFAWRVSVEDETAWYDAEPPHTLLQYDSGPLIWQLTSSAPAS